MAVANQAQPAPPTFGGGDLAAIQGIGVAGFKKDHQEVVFLRFGPGAAAKSLVNALAPRIATADEVG